MLVAQKPTDDALRVMAVQPKMTFARMARELAIDRKTVRRWCKDIGIEKCGLAATVNETAEIVNEKAKSVTVEPEIVNETPKIDTGKPFAETALPGENPDSRIAALENKVSWLIEWNTMFHDRLRALEDAMAGAACPVPYMVQPVFTEKLEPDLFNSMLNVAYKIGAGEELTNDESDFFADFCMMTRAATANDFIKLERKLENHWHASLCLAESRAYVQEKKGGQRRTEV